MKIWSKIRETYNAIRNKKYFLPLISFAIILIAGFFIPILINELYIDDEGYRTVWQGQDVLSFYGSLLGSIGTILLGVVTYRFSTYSQKVNERLSEENIYYQKVVSQRLFPIIGIKDVRTSKCENVSKLQFNFSNSIKPQMYSRYLQCKDSSMWEEVLMVNIDVNNEIYEPHYKKTICLEICNISDAVIRHILVDDVVINGFKGKFDLKHCTNTKLGNGFSCLLPPNGTMPLTIDIFFKDEIIKNIYDEPLSGGQVGIMLFLTNTTITGIQQKQYVSMHVTGSDKCKISYGDKTYIEVSEKWTN